ncbi:MAG: Ferredoxin-2 [Firmicutes bacterium]|nr:Ferredoxin-2 [candidate division NPL-UPA2 bacterium]
MPPKVYFLPLPDGAPPAAQAAALATLFAASDAAQALARNDFTLIKFSVGEKNNDTHIAPALVKTAVDFVRNACASPFLGETSTLYKGERMDAVKHLLHAERQGFSIAATGAPFIMLDGLLGNSELDVEIQGELFPSVKIAREAVLADSLITLNHPTGHIATGLGACIKNLGMGLASRMGKMRQHSSMKPAVIAEKCVACKKCLEWCPADCIALTHNKALIDPARCIGCGECLTVCRFDAIQYNWGADPAYLQKAMAEYAYGSVKAKAGKAYHFNIMVNMTKDCDCISRKQHKLIPDLGLLASADPVAIDVATLDLTAKVHSANLTALSYPKHDPYIQLRHAAKVGMGSLEYELIDIK